MTDEERRTYKQKFRNDMEAFVREKVEETRQIVLSSGRSEDPLAILDVTQAMLELMTMGDARNYFGEEKIQVHREVFSEIIAEMKQRMLH